ncbi:uncharacterized protein LOC127243297 isoform X2 [Andrographis paniculata]|uniref:uncharacterized protein LOC127243297 isoform X2 n=1 Tax=Andrographis paniculata TaxID=175694 RepID=UPI0021E950EA|nr:uncharacterized protein LOC127243297 isoform X2 [Andrographis paniculata]
MLSGGYSALLLGFIVTVLAVECSNANGHLGNVEAKGKNLSSRKAKKVESHHSYIPEEDTVAAAQVNHVRKFLVGRKNQLGINGKPIHISGKCKSDEAQRSCTEQQQQQQNSENSHIDDSVEKDGLTAFLEAADQVANLMRKDYTGKGRGRRKPPVNNQEPKV